MKKNIYILLIVIFSFTCVCGFSAQDETQYVTVRHSLAPILGGPDYFRGAAFGTQVLWNHYRLVYLGMQSNIEYDAALNIWDVSMEFLIGINPYVWLLSGLTAPVGTPTVKDGDTNVTVSMNRFFNTFGIGAEFYSIEFFAWRIGFFGEFKYLLNWPIGDYKYQNINGTLLNFKIYLGGTFSYSH